jgi:hypothetical protein
VAVDTTVMEKAIAHPTDSRLYERARDQLVTLAQEAGVELRQSYARLAPRLALQVGRYAHAKQFKRMRKALKKLKGYTGRVMRDLRRHLQDIPEGSLRDRIIAKLALVSHLLHQQPKGADKIYALHEPEVDCISKGKARVRYEFGCNVSVATTLDEGFVVGMRSFAGNPYDGHTLKEALEQVAILTDQRPDVAVVDRGYPLAGRAFANAREARPWRSEDPRPDQRHEARPDTKTRRRPPPTKCIDPLKICSCYKREDSDECDDGRQHQTVDSEAKDGACCRDHPRQDDGRRGQQGL